MFFYYTKLLPRAKDHWGRLVLCTVFGIVNSRYPPTGRIFGANSCTIPPQHHWPAPVCSLYQGMISKLLGTLLAQKQPSLSSSSSSSFLDVSTSSAQLLPVLRQLSLSPSWSGLKWQQLKAWKTTTQRHHEIRLMLQKTSVPSVEVGKFLPLLTSGFFTRF